MNDFERSGCPKLFMMEELLGQLWKELEFQREEIYLQQREIDRLREELKRYQSSCIQ